MTKYVAPQADSRSYTCPHCGVLAQVSARTLFEDKGAQVYWHITTCTVCFGEMMWFNNELRWPLAMTGPLPHEDLPLDIAALFTEAREIGGRSPRSAAALLRLALQTLIRDLEPGEKNLNTAIGKLVAKGMPQRIQQAMDILRVTANDSVHPSGLRLKDDPATVAALFELLNMIVESQITEPARVNAMFEKLPEGPRLAIQERDGARTSE